MVSGPYLTANRFRLGGFGIDVSTIAQVALAQTMQRASTRVRSARPVGGAAAAAACDDNCRLKLLLLDQAVHRIKQSTNMFDKQSSNHFVLMRVFRRVGLRGPGVIS